MVLALMENLLSDLLTSPFALLGFAIMLDMLVGEPNWLWSRLPHPVVLFGKAISALEHQFNHCGFTGKMRRFLGIIAISLWVGLAILIGLVTLYLLAFLPPALGFITEMILVAILLAGRSLYDHIQAVMTCLKDQDISAARYAVSMIVGRDTTRLDKSDIARAAIETGAENLSDGIIAPTFWYLIGGVPGILAYKMINTADSMVGYKSARYYAFGWGAAMVDDIVNLLPARLTGLLIILCAFFEGKAQGAVKIMQQDASAHASPNAGYPEAAMAGALAIRLGGARSYRGSELALPAMNETGRDQLDWQDIDSALRLIWRSLGICAVGCFVIAYL